MQEEDYRWGKKIELNYFSGLSAYLKPFSLQRQGSSIGQYINRKFHKDGWIEVVDFEANNIDKSDRQLRNLYTKYRKVSYLANLELVLREISNDGGVVFAFYMKAANSYNSLVNQLNIWSLDEVRNIILQNGGNWLDFEDLEDNNYYDKEHLHSSAAINFSQRLAEKITEKINEK